MTNFNFAQNVCGWDSGPDPAGELTTIPQAPCLELEMSVSRILDATTLFWNPSYSSGYLNQSVIWKTFQM